MTSRDYRFPVNSWVSLQDLACRKSILVTADGTEYLLLRDQRRVMQVLCVGESIAIEPCAIGLLANRVPGVRSKANLMFRFEEMCWSSKSSQKPVDWMPQSLSFRNALIALDGSINGASHREIAEVIFGPEEAGNDWAGGHGWMKSRIVRAIKKGRELMEGGYRNLLK